MEVCQVLDACHDWNNSDNPNLGCAVVRGEDSRLEYLQLALELRNDRNERQARSNAYFFCTLFAHVLIQRSILSY